MDIRKQVLLIWLLLFGGFVLKAQQTVGLFLNEPASYQGYTLFSNNTNTYLIDNCGFVVNQWGSDYKPGNSVYLLEDGNLLRTAKINGDFSAGGVGGRFELYNWQGDLLWSFEIADENQQAHHDIAPLPNGNFLAIVWDKISASEAQQAGRAFSGSVWSEKIVEIKMEGTDQATIVWEWKLRDHLVQEYDSAKDNYGIVADHPQRINFNHIGAHASTSGDWIHLNAIDYHVGLDQIALSSRNFSEIWLIDHSTTTQEAAGHSGGNANKGGDILYRYGNPVAYDRGTEDDQQFFEQHDVTWLSETELMVFNNNFMPGQSRIERWTLPTDANGGYHLNGEEAFGPAEVDWFFATSGFYSPIMSSAKLLPNDNILICEGSEGRFFEITPSGELVWEYINPVNGNGFPVLQGGTPQFNQTFSIRRYSIDYPAFDGLDLSPGEPVELVPWDSDCEIHQTTSATAQNAETQIHLLQNPVNETLGFHNDFGALKVHVYNLVGQKIGSFDAVYGINYWNISSWNAGQYFFVMRYPTSTSVIPFVKI